MPVSLYSRVRRLAPALLLAPLAIGADCSDPDDYVAPWPQNAVQTPDYDESPAAGPMRVKAAGYDAWHRQWHQPDYGATVTTYFTDPSRTEMASIAEWGDSTIWTGTYLASQAWRYHVTGDPEAKANAIRSVHALDGHLRVTGTPGYIARYRGPQTSSIYQGDAWCESQSRCFHLEAGPFAGDFWWGSTSRDQYTGWMLGMSTAYDLIDDEPTRAVIRAAVLEVVGTLIANDWVIMDQDGTPSDTAPQVLAPAQLSWAVQGFHVTGDETIRAELARLLLDENRGKLVFASIDLFNRYDQYYSNNLGHELWYPTLRLGKAYFSAADYQYLLDHFNERQHTYTRLSHNAWFNGIYMSQGGWQSSGPGDPYAAQLVQDLGEFRQAPNDRYFLPPRDPGSYVVDPVSQQLADLEDQYPEFFELVNLSFDPQALEAFPVGQQCSTDFLWQRSPFVIQACGANDPRFVNPGVDYLAAYWLAAYEKLIAKPL